MQNETGKSKHQAGRVACNYLQVCLQLVHVRAYCLRVAADVMPLVFGVLKSLLQNETVGWALHDGRGGRPSAPMAPCRIFRRLLMIFMGVQVHYDEYRINPAGRKCAHLSAERLLQRAPVDPLSSAGLRLLLRLLLLLCALPSSLMRAL